MTDSKPKITIRYATPADSDRITEFRITQFKTAKEFELINPSLLALQRGHIYLIEQDDQIISTMQIETSTDKEHFQKISTAHIPDPFDDFDTAYLSKGATIKEYRNSGLNSYLRRLTLLNAINNASIESLTGFAYENAPRLNLLKDLGYEFIETKLLDQSFTIPKGKVFFLKLQRKNFSFAYEKLINETYNLDKQFEIINQTHTTISSY